MTTKEKVEQWIEDGKDFNAGIQLLNVIGKNKKLAQNISRNPKRYASTLEAELRKYGNVWKEKTKAVVVKDMLPKPEDFNKFPGPVAPDPEAKTEGEETDEIPAGENTEAEEETVNVEAEKAEAPEAPAKAETYPPEIEKIKSEYSRLYNLRARLHGQLTDVAPDNAPANVKKRKTLGDSISEISLKLELLYAAKEAYFETGTMPDMDALFGDPKKVIHELAELPNDVKELKKMKKALQVSIHKAKNKLEFQEETKQKRSNPMPSGPKRLDLEKTIEEKTAEIERIEYKLVELAH